MVIRDQTLLFKYKTIDLLQFIWYLLSAVCPLATGLKFSLEWNSLPGHKFFSGPKYEIAILWLHVPPVLRSVTCQLRWRIYEMSCRRSRLSNRPGPGRLRWRHKLREADHRLISTSVTWRETRLRICSSRLWWTDSLQSRFILCKISGKKIY